MRRSPGISRTKTINRSDIRAAIQSTVMCGRYRLSRRAEILAAYDAEYQGVDWDARYNIAPTQNVPIIRQDAKEPIRRASLMRWGLVPYWAQDPTLGARMINARAETAADKPAFKESLERRRCLIPADGFYEWQRSGRSKQPYCFELTEQQPFAFAVCGIDGYHHMEALWRRAQFSQQHSISFLQIFTTRCRSSFRQ